MYRMLPTVNAWFALLGRRKTAFAGELRDPQHSYFPAASAAALTGATCESKKSWLRVVPCTGL